MPKKKDGVFHITITSVGVPYFSAGYKRIEEDNAEVLLRNVIALIAKDLVGEDAHLSLVYTTCLDIFKRLMKPEVDINKKIKELSEVDIKWWDYKPPNAPEDKKETTP